MCLKNATIGTAAGVVTEGTLAFVVVVVIFRLELISTEERQNPMGIPSCIKLAARAKQLFD
jgi:hypothetical protein